MDDVVEPAGEPESAGEIERARAGVPLMASERLRPEGCRGGVLSEGVSDGSRCCTGGIEFLCSLGACQPEFLRHNMCADAFISCSNAAADSLLSSFGGCIDRSDSKSNLSS